MDNNKLIGFTLIMLLIVVYYSYFSPNQAPIIEDEITETEKITNEKVTISNNTNEILNENYSSNNNNKEETITIENENLVIDFNSKGAKILNVFLKKFKNTEGNQVKIYGHKESNINYQLTSKNKIDLDKIIFKHSTRKSDEEIRITFKAISNDSNTITISYILKNNSYLVENDISYNDNSSSNKILKINWLNKIHHQEKNISNEKLQTTINYYYKSEDFDYLSASSKENQNISVNESLLWITSKQQFFTSGIINETGFVNSDLESIYLEDSSFVKSLNINTEISMINEGISFQYFFGPNKYSLMKDIDNDFYQNINLGWIGVNFFNKNIIIPIFNFLETLTTNYGLIIFLMVLLIRLIITPLTYKSHISMAKLKVLNPEIKKIKDKHDGDMQKSQAEIMELYQKTGVSPLGGCLPLLFQLPILVSIFYFIPNSVELRGKSFLWAQDLSNYDSILNLPFTIPFYGDHISLFTLLMTVSTLLINQANSQMQTIEGPMKTVQYVFPFMFLFIFNNFSSGLTYYYFLSNVASYAQIIIFKRFVDDEKLKKEIEINRKKTINKKKSSFQLRLEEAMKAKQESKKKNN
jgi:YidC/Oxa1 family membrane protein insertase